MSERGYSMYEELDAYEDTLDAMRERMEYDFDDEDTDEESESESGSEDSGLEESLFGDW